MGRKSPRDSTWIRNLHQNKNTSIRIQYHPVAKENYKNTAEFKVFWNKKKTAIKRLCWTLFTDKRLSEHHQNLSPCEENAGRFFFLDEILRVILTTGLSLSYRRSFRHPLIVYMLGEASCLCYYEKMACGSMKFQRKKILVKNNPIINLDLSELDKKII